MESGYAFLTSTLDGGEWPATRLGRFTPGEEATGTRWGSPDRRGLCE
jgi:hypothetical protein